LSGLVWFGLVWSRLVSSRLVWSRLVWSGLVWSGLVVSSRLVLASWLVGLSSRVDFFSSEGSFSQVLTDFFVHWQKNENVPNQKHEPSRHFLCHFLRHFLIVILSVRRSV
jgi:hypothetical protein